MTEIASIIKIFMEPGFKKGSPAQAALKPGALLTGRITEILPSGLLQIDFGKFRSQARGRFPVAKGDTLRFEVLETGDPIKLKIQEPPPATIRETARRLYKPQDLHQFRQALEAILQKPGDPFMNRESLVKSRLLLSRLSRYLLPLQPEKGSAQVETLLKSSLNNSGIFFEKRIETALLQIFKTPDRIDVGRAVSHPFITNIFDSDLKPTLLKLVAALVKPGVSGERAPASIRHALLGLLDHIHTQQARLAHHAPTGSEKRSFTYNPADRSLSGMQKTPTLNLSAAAFKDPLLKAIRIYARENRITLDHKTETALHHLGKTLQEQAPRSTSALPGSGRLSPGVKQNLITLKGFIDSQTTPAPGKSRPGSLRHRISAAPGSRVAGNDRENLRVFSALVERKAAALKGEFDRLGKTLAKLSSESPGHPDGKKIAKTARSIRALIQQHQLPSGDGVNRALSEMESGLSFSKTTPAAAIKTGPFTERMILDLVLLREFVDQQKTELNQSLILLRNLLGRTETEADRGDRHGSERSRAADPVQVIAFSLPLEDGKKAARLKVYYPLKRDNRTQPGFRISLLLSMDRMGRIRSDIFKHSRNLDIRFSTESEITRRHIGEHINRLGDLLRNQFETVNLSTAVDTKTITAFEYEDLELSDDRMVDLQV